MGGGSVVVFFQDLEMKMFSKLLLFLVLGISARIDESYDRSNYGDRIKAHDEVNSEIFY
jgi:hypothetical protein